MKKRIRAFIILNIFFIIFSINITGVYATDFSIGGIISGADDFIDSANIDTIDESSLQEFSNTMYNILLSIAIIIAFVVGGILGIKFLIEGIEEKAQIKEMLFPYFMGCVVVFGAFVIWKVVVIALQ